MIKSSLNEAKIYIIHEKTVDGDVLLKEKISINGQSQSKLKTNCYTCVLAKPGQYKIENEGTIFLGKNSKLAGSIDIDVEAGKEYYVSYKMKYEKKHRSHTYPEWINEPVGAEWTILDEAKGKELISKMKCVKPIKDSF